MIDFGMRAERRDLVQLPAEGKRPARVERHGVDLPRQPLLAKGEQRAGVRIHADVDRRLEPDPTLEAIALERRAKCSKHRAVSRLLGRELHAADKTVRDAYAFIVKR